MINNSYFLKKVRNSSKSRSSKISFADLDNFLLFRLPFWYIFMIWRRRSRARNLLILFILDEGDDSASLGDNPSFLTLLSLIARSRGKRNCRLTSTIVNRPHAVYRRKSLEREERTLELVALVPSIYLFWYATKPRPLLRVTAIPRLITSKNLTFSFCLSLASGASTVSPTPSPPRRITKEEQKEEKKRKGEKKGRGKGGKEREGQGGKEREQWEEMPA